MIFVINGIVNSLMLLNSVRVISKVLVCSLGVMSILALEVGSACGIKLSRFPSAVGCRGQTCSFRGVVGQIIGVIFVVLLLNLIQLARSHHSMVIFILAFSQHHRNRVFGD